MTDEGAMVRAGGEKQGPVTIQVEAGRERSEMEYTFQGQDNK